MKKFDAISIGSALQDIFILNKDMICKDVKVCHPFNPENMGDKINVKKMYFDIGGGGTNGAATLANMGLKTAVVCQVGRDLAGEKVISTMKNFRVNTDFVTINKKEETGYSVIFIDKDGDKTALVYRGASDLKKYPATNISRLSTKWFFITSLHANLKLLGNIYRKAKKLGAKIAWNPGGAELNLGKEKLKNFLAQTDILFLNLKEAQKLSGVKRKNIKQIFERLERVSPGAIIAVTGGKSGAWVKNGLETLWADILDRKVVNATGAGDAFGSGFVAGLFLYKGDVKKSLQLAMLNSNSVVTEMGAKHGLLPRPPATRELNKITIKLL
ncbi:carbohydrate kinase family protein [Candidatus Kuenenbacteria bacterium]|nr:carbohydrate kinase family protein [Candidatus Kuenenbacteria bacterium]